MNNSARSAYLDATVATACPARLLVMLCERLVIDVQRAVDALERAAAADAHAQLVHAQDIVIELRVSLRPEEFRGGKELAALYTYLHQRLILANVRKDTVLALECLGLVTGIRDTWREAALQASGVHAAATRSA